jgi:hypothetical protein
MLRRLAAMLAVAASSCDSIAEISAFSTGRMKREM